MVVSRVTSVCPALTLSPTFTSTLVTLPNEENASCASLTGTITADAETESASLVCVLFGALPLSNDMVGMAVGADVGAQADKTSATIIRASEYIVFIRIL
jgi:hypothetical protein